MRKYTLKDKRLSIISRIVLILIWIVLSHLIDNEVIFPTINSTINSLIDIVKDPKFITIISYSLMKGLIGFFISLVIAVIMGILSSIFKIVYHIMAPIINFLSSVPTMAIIILALIWLNNEIVPMFVGFIMVFPILYETVLKGILNIDNKIIEMAQVYDVDRLIIVKDIYLPSIFNNLSHVFESALGLNLKMVIAGEVLAQPKYGIGSSLQLQKMYLNTSGVFAWIIIILLIVKMIQCLLSKMKHILGANKWKG